VIEFLANTMIIYMDIITNFSSMIK